MAMDSITDILSESKSMLDKFYKDETNENEHKIHNQDELRENVANFVANQMKSISRQDKLRSVIESEILQKVALHELSVSELQSMYSTISKEKSSNTDVLMKLFAPTPQTTSPIITPATKDEQVETIQLTPEQRNALNRLTLVMEKLNKQNSNIENKSEE